MISCDIIKGAVYCQKCGYILEAHKRFEEGVDLLKRLSVAEKERARKMIYRKRYCEWNKHLDGIQKQMKQYMAKTKLVKRIRIEREASGKSYRNLFKKYLEPRIKEVFIYEPYLRDEIELENLVNFVELIGNSCRQLKYVRVISREPPKNFEEQMKDVLDKLQQQMKEEGDVIFNVSYEKLLKERKIICSNGLIIKIGRGLHLYMPVDEEQLLESISYNYRLCYPTEIEIKRAKPFAEILDNLQSSQPLKGRVFAKK